jgi:co-chaperonin GroES (HSP10)
MKLIPLRDGLVIKIDRLRDDVTSSGIVLTARTGIHTSQEQIGLRGTVVYTGTDIDNDQLRIGHRVLLGEFQHPEYVENGDRYVMVRDQDICGVIEE